MTPQQRDSLLQTAQQYQQNGRLREAEQLYRQVLESEPNHPRALFMLGALAHHRGELPAAINWLAQASTADPKFAEAPFLLGVVLQQKGELPAAMQAYFHALSLDPNHVKALNNLGRALLDQGKITEGINTLQHVIRIAPQHASAYSNLGNAMRILRDFENAIVHFQRAIALQPNLAEAHSNLGATFAERGQYAQGIASLRQALCINPRLASAHFNMAKLLHERNQFDDALRHCRQFIELRPDYADAHNLLGTLVGLGGEMPQAIVHQRRAIALKPNSAPNASNLLLSLHYVDDLEPQAIFQAHLDWSRQFINPSAASPALHTNDRNPNRKLRVGYVSPNFQQHSVAHFLESVLPAHDPTNIEIFCYADLIRPDPMTARFRAMPVIWREITKQPDQTVADQIRADAIDILVDLAGHTCDNRMLLFAMKPAPVQFTWLGYPNTTGLPTMDYRITDAIADPPGQTEALHTEKLIRFEGGCWAYSPPLDSPPVKSLPALSNGFVTFGSFNNLPKVTPTVIHTWARILIAVPNSRLLIKSMGLSGSIGQNYIRSHIARHGVNPARVELLAWTPNTSSHLEIYNRVDIALDTFPYNGTTTTVEALWMGAPVVTLAGQTHISRVGTSLLTHAGLIDWIAQDIPAYIKFAAAKARDISALSERRQSLRSQLQASPVCNGPRLARQLEEAFRTAWTIWVG